ncbi:hypothetical protein D3C81_1894560 [compost metagenome]
MQVGARQLHFLGNVAHRRAAEAFFGKDLFGGQQDFIDVTATDLDLVIAHKGSLTAAWVKTSITKRRAARKAEVDLRRSI